MLLLLTRLVAVPVDVCCRQAQPSLVAIELLPYHLLGKRS